MIAPEFSHKSTERFSLNPEQVERSLEEIMEDPKHALTDIEAAYLEFNNPNLSVLLFTGAQSLPKQDSSAYVEAALTVYKISREAGTSDGMLPKLSSVGCSVLANYMIDMLKTSGQIVPTPSVARVTRDAFESELLSEPSVVNVVGRLSAYRIDRDAYYAGAATVVAGLRLAAIQQSLEK